MQRRRFLRNSATVAAAWSLLPQLRAARSAQGDLPPHPRLFIAAGPNDAGLQSVDDFRVAVQEPGFLADSWTKTVALAHAEKELPPLQPDSPVLDRPASSIRDRNLDYHLCHQTGSRMNRFALVHLVTGDEGCKDAALAQLRALFDPDQWPDWIDQAHVRFGHPADLRTGMLSQDCALAYDWLYESLNDAERAEIREGIQRRGIQPFLTSVEQGPWWMTDLNNWVTVIAGGVAIAAMAMRENLPQAQAIIDLATERFDAYLDTYGPEGEFNESVSYAGANRLPVGHFTALRFATGGGVNRIGEWPFPEMCRWVMHGTLDEGRPVPFGDSWPERTVMTGYIAAVAAATQDPVLQYYFLNNRAEEDAHPMNLLYYDARLKPLSPAGREPLAIAYRAHGGMIVSRTSWDKPRTDCIVFSKFGREEQHENNDLGQLGFDALGERLIIDIGSPSSYPADFFDGAARWEYYNASVKGHNTLIFGGREQRWPQRVRGEPIHTKEISGKLKHWWHEPEQGTAWSMDLTPAYSGVKHFTRTVLHLWPGYILVLDDATTEQREPISLRWHPINEPELTADGAFVVRNGIAATSAQIINLGEGDPAITLGHHAYTAPYDRERNGDPLEQRNEPFIDTTLTHDRCRLLTLFATGAIDDFGGATAWQETADGWVFDGPHGPVTAQVSATHVSLAAPQLERKVTVDLT
jgi:hypothetical protein